MINLIPTRKQWRRWSLPSKLTAIGALVGVLSFTAYMIEKGYLLSSANKVDTPKIEDVYLILEFNNQNPEELSLYTRGELFYWHPGQGAYHEVYTFEITHSENNSEKNGIIIVPSKSKIRATAKLLPVNKARYYLEKGHMSISLFIKGENINSQFSPTVAFTKNNLEGAYIPINLEAKKS